MNEASDSLEKTDGKNSKEFQILKIFLENVSKTAGIANRYLRKLLLTSVFTSTIIACIAFDWIGDFYVGLILCILIAYLPLLFIMFLRSKLTKVESLPEEINEIENLADEITKKLMEDELINNLKEFISQEELNLRKRIKSLVSIAPLLYKIKDKLIDIVRPDIFIAVYSVANPIFAFLMAFVIVPVGLWAIVSIILSIIWFFTI